MTSSDFKKPFLKLGVSSCLFFSQLRYGFVRFKPLLKLKPTLPGCLRQSFNPAVVLVTTPVKGDLAYSPAGGTLGQHQTDHFSPARL
jgi:hypothetical protein